MSTTGLDRRSDGLCFTLTRKEKKGKCATNESEVSDDDVDRVNSAKMMLEEDASNITDDGLHRHTLFKMILFLNYLECI